VVGKKTLAAVAVVGGAGHAGDQHRWRRVGDLSMGSRACTDVLPFLPLVDELPMQQGRVGSPSRREVGHRLKLIVALRR